MRTQHFRAWLIYAGWLISQAPLLWLSYSLILGLLLSLGRVSLGLGVFIAMTGLFVGIGIAKYVELKASPNQEAPLNFLWALKKSLPLAVLGALSMVVSWFVFRLLNNLYSGEYAAIMQFFFYWEFIPENIATKNVLQLFAWLYGYASAALIFVILMLTTFASWFSYPLMLFQSKSWSTANNLGNAATIKHRSALYKLLGFIFLLVFFGGGILPMLIPFIYTLVSILIYVSYQSVFSEP
ncbi:MAG: hypothetical protein WC782_11730 [Methylococcaceae bacterium]|jgi:hypothetical protein